MSVLTLFFQVICQAAGITLECLRREFCDNMRPATGIIFAKDIAVHDSEQDASSSFVDSNKTCLSASSFGDDHFWGTDKPCQFRSLKNLSRHRRGKIRGKRSLFYPHQFFSIVRTRNKDIHILSLCTRTLSEKLAYPNYCEY